jgi:WD40 repeat protein
MFVYDLKERTLFKEIVGHTAGIYTFALSRAGDYLISGGGDCSARIWKLPEFESAGTLNTDGNTIFSLAVNKGFTEIICAGIGGVVRIFNFPALSLKANFDAKSGVIQSMGITSNDNYLIIGTRNNVIKVYNYNERTEYCSFNSHENWVRNLVVSKDDNYFISVSADKSIRIFNIKNKCEELNLEGSEGYVFGEYLSKDGQYLLTGASDKIMRLWNLGKPNRVSELEGHSKTIMSIAVTSDDKYLVTGSEDKTVMVWDLVEFSQAAVLTSHSETVWSVAVTKDSKYIASASGDKKVILWDFATKEIYATLEGHTNPIFCVTFNNRGTVAVSGAQDKNLIVWDVNEKSLKKTLNGHTDTVFAVKISFDDNFIISGAADYTIRIWSLQALEQVEKIETKAGMIESISLSNDGKYLAFGDRANKVSLWDWTTRTPIKKFSKHNKWVKSVSFSADNNLFVSASNDFSVRVWNASEERQEFILRGHTASVRAARFTNDGKFVISAGEDKKIKVWNVFDVDSFELTDISSSLESFLYLTKIKTKRPSSFSHAEYTFGQLRINLAHFYAYMNYDVLLHDAFFDGVEIKRDIEGHTPLFYALARSSQNCIDIILKYMNRIKFTENELYLNYCHAMRDDFERLLCNHSVYLPDFLEEIFYSVNDLPNFAVPKVSLPILHFSQTKAIDVSQFVYSIEETPPGTDEIPIEFKTLPFPIPFHGGSTESIILLKNITKCPNDRILQTKFIKSYITNKWDNIWPFIMFLTSIMWLNIILMSVVIVRMYSISWETHIVSQVVPELICFIIVNLVLALYELLQAITTGSTYFTEFWNMIDILRSTLCLAWGFMSFSFTQEDLFVITWIMVVLNFFRGLTGFRAFSTTRFYTRLIIRAFSDSSSFLFIFFYSTFAFGVIYFVSQEGVEKDIFKLWSSPYQLNMGEISDANKENPATYIYFMMASVINVIIMLNLLISILGDSFDSFQMDAMQIDFLEQAELILEIESLMFWKRDLNERLFLQTCQELTVEENQAWEGKVTMIMKSIRKMKTDVRNDIADLKKMMQNILDKMPKK